MSKLPWHDGIYMYSRAALGRPGCELAQYNLSSASMLHYHHVPYFFILTGCDTLIISNLPFDEWTSVLGSERLAGALLDPLTHHVHILEMNGESYRLATSKKQQKQTLPTKLIDKEDAKPI
ncbi:ATP-binding protein [Nitrosomonas communis]|uniref:ATP-binding protein n=1 Tax=Nitrosomonas communis TaxID=44574 RepID=UPI003D2D31DF